MCIFLAGCSGTDPAPVVAPSGEPPVAAEPATTASAAVAVAEPPAAAGADQTKWLGKIPYDVFYDRPADLIGATPALGETTTVAVSRPAATAPAATATSDAASVSEPSIGTSRWAEVISGDTLDEEAKLIRTRLTGNLQTVATYNNSIDATTVDTLVLAALAGIAERTDGDVRWKDRAAEIKTLAYDVWSAVGSRGAKAFRETQEPFETLLVAMDGGRVDVEATAEEPFGDYADRSSLMQRIDQSLNWLKVEVGSGEKLKAKQRDVIREASVLAALGEVVAQPSYEYTEEKEYADSVTEFVNACIAVREAAEGDDYAGYQNAISRVQTQCNVCHGRYKFGDDGL